MSSFMKWMRQQGEKNSFLVLFFLTALVLGSAAGTHAAVSFGPAAQFGAGQDPRSIVTGDSERDGKKDIVAANYNGNPVSVLLRNGEGTYQPAVNDAAGCSPSAVSAYSMQQAAAPSMQLAVVALENRFIATGVIISIQPPVTGIHKFILRIKKTEHLEGYASFGADYQGKEVEVLSEIGMPSSLTAGATVSVVLRVSGDEWRQTVFLVEVLKNGSGQ